jgi:hypothetical protein
MVFVDLIGHGRLAGRGVCHTPWLMASIIVVGESAYAIRLYQRDPAYPTIFSNSINTGQERRGNIVETDGR